MLEHFHGLDRHKRSSMISILNREGKEEKLISVGLNLNDYIKSLGPKDAVVMESCIGSFYWADKIESKGSSCAIIDPYRFRIIKDSWNKTDKNDCRNMSKALWVHKVTGEFGLPQVYKPSQPVRELRKLFTQYGNLNKYINKLKNNIQSTLMDNGVVLSSDDKSDLFSQKRSDFIFSKLDISSASKISIEISLDILWKVEEKKKLLTNEIIKAGISFEKEVKLLISIKGITPLSALAFLSDVGDVRRFKTLRKMNAYLGLVPRIKESGDKTRVGHINKASRKLTRSLLTQSLIQAIDASPYFRKFYDDVKSRRGAGRSRIALIRK
jgi:transposase